MTAHVMINGVEARRCLTRFEYCRSLPESSLEKKLYGIPPAGTERVIRAMAWLVDGLRQKRQRMAFARLFKEWLRCR